MGLISYIEETFDELVNKVSWPTWNELQSSAIVVMVASGLIAMMVWGMDIVFGINPSEDGWKGVLGTLYDIFQS